MIELDDATQTLLVAHISTSVGSAVAGRTTNYSQEVEYCNSELLGYIRSLAAAAACRDR